MSRIVGVVALAAFGVGGFVVAAVSREVAAAKLALYETGVRGDAEVVDLRDQFRRRASRRCFISYRFAGGIVEREIAEADYTVTRKGQVIAVWHDATDPSRFVSERERGHWTDEATWTPLSFAAGGMFLVVVAAYLFVDGRRRATS